MVNIRFIPTNTPIQNFIRRDELPPYLIISHTCSTTASYLFELSVHLTCTNPLIPWEFEKTPSYIVFVSHSLQGAIDIARLTKHSDIHTEIVLTSMVGPKTEIRGAVQATLLTALVAASKPLPQKSL